MVFFFWQVLLLENNNLRDQIQQLQEVKGLNLPPTAEVATPTPEEATPTTEVTLPTAEVAPSEDMEMEVEQTGMIICKQTKFLTFSAHVISYVCTV